MPDYGQYDPYTEYDDLPSGRQSGNIPWSPGPYLSRVEPDDEQRTPYRGREFRRLNQGPQSRRTADPTAPASPSTWQAVDRNAPGHNYLSDIWRWMQAGRKDEYDDPRLRGYPQVQGPPMPPRGSMPQGGPAPMEASAAPSSASSLEGYSDYDQMRMDDARARMMAAGQPQPEAPQRPQPRRQFAPPPVAQGNMAPPQQAPELAFAPPAAPEQAPMQQAPAPRGSPSRDAIMQMLQERNSKAPWLALTAAGFGTAGGGSPWAGVNAGKGGLEGVKTYNDLQEQDAARRLRAATLALQGERDDESARHSGVIEGQGAQRVGFEGQRVGLEGQRVGLEGKRVDNEAARRTDERRLREMELGQTGPLRAAQADSASANAEYTREEKGAVAKDRITAGNVAKAETLALSAADKRYPKSLTGERPPEYEAYLDRMRSEYRQQLTGGGEKAPVSGARKAPDGKWYVQRGDKYFEVVQP